MGHRILLADDSLTIQKVVELTFSETDYELMAVGSGDRAVEALSEFRPDIVLADVVMPGLTGYEVCERVKKLPDGLAIPVILLTGTFEPFDRARAERVGCDSIVTKPFDSHALAALVGQLVARGAEIRAALAAVPSPASVPPPVPAPTPAPAVAADPFSDTVAFRQPEAFPPAAALEDIFSAPVSEAPVLPPPPSLPPPLPAAEPFLPVEEAAGPEGHEPSVAAVVVEAVVPPIEVPSAPPEPVFTPQSRADEDTHPLLVISAPPPVAEEPEGEGVDDVQPRDIERDLEAFEQTGKGRSRPEVWDQAEALGVISRVETSGEHTAVERMAPLPRDNEDLEVLAAQARMTDLSELIPVTREPVPIQASAPVAAGVLSDAEVERIARRVIQMIGEKFIRDVAWEVVPETAERIVRERLTEIENG
jgi:CheY-like chemotaxis protein